jgi:hypothetical protein
VLGSPASFVEPSCPAATPGGAAPADASLAPPSSAATRLLILIALYSVPAATIIRPVNEFDTWYHLRTGEWIVAHGAVPETDPFTPYGESRPWVAYSWLFELMLYGLYRWLGLGGLLVYRVLLALALIAVLHRFVARREPRFVVAVGLVAAALLGIAPFLSERPWLFTIILCVLSLDAVLDLRQGQMRWTIWLLPLGYVLWASVHIQFIYGLFVLGLGCAAPLFDRFLRWDEGSEQAARFGTRAWWQLVGLTALCFGATFVNPYGIEVYRTILDLAGQSAPYQLFGELKAPDFRALSDWALLGLTLTAAFALGRRARLSSFEVLLLAATAYLSFRCRRDSWFVVLAALGVLTTGPRRAATEAERLVLTWRQRGLVAAGVVLVLLVIGWRRDCSERHLEAEVAQEFPAEAAAFIESNGLRGPLYNHHDWGSYLLWRLPQLPPAIDGRMNIHGDERITQFQRTFLGAPGWEDDPDLTAAGVAVVHAWAPLAALLRRDGRFQLVHEDPVAVVFVARASEGAAPRGAQASTK